MGCPIELDSLLVVSHRFINLAFLPYRKRVGWIDANSFVQFFDMTLISVIPYGLLFGKAIFSDHDQR